MEKSKRYLYAKKLVFDVLRKEKYFKKKDKKNYSIFRKHYYDDWKVKNYQFWKKWDEKRHGKVIANSILQQIFWNSEFGLYYDQEEMEDFVDKYICRRILTNMDQILDDPEGNARSTSDGIPARQRIIDVEEAINDLKQIDNRMANDFEIEYKELIGEE